MDDAEYEPSTWDMVADHVERYLATDGDDGFDFHGAKGGGPKGIRNGMYRHGLYTREAKDERRAINDLLRRCRDELAAN